ncbi:MAG: site-2 protease family protein [Clostridia bacterium]|nr:site-2 protease family protein [Clostridia bacterium]
MMLNVISNATIGDFFMQLLSYLGAFLVLMVMVIVHEFGHYVAGKLLNFKIEEFAIGMGPKIFSVKNKKNGEVFSLRCLPLGGFCAFYGEEDESPEQVKDANKIFFGSREESKVDENRSFHKQHPFKRIIVLLAGVTFNFVFALLVAIFVFSCIGDYLPQIKEINVDSPNAIVLQQDDVIYSIDGETIYLTAEISEKIAQADQVFDMVVIRNGNKVLIEGVQKYTFTSTDTQGNPVEIFGVGISMGYTQERVKFPFFEAVGRAFGYCFYVAFYILRIFGDLLTGALGLEAVGGPITTITTTSQIVASGIENVLLMMVLISVNLAIFNLLPVPALDGCQVIFVLVEWITGKPINRNLQGILNFIGLIFLFGFAILVDILRL